ncbi:Transmembrane_domain-containing protein [Hexamita inflata]|uniref:Transmembrane domain-containing protein n=1 Tax=Hexamita inflata TaxID=28002 RepID=A0AA86N936_9EUKA|nr:Transmembrane domain-containing protein [Hexamita inflata]
MSSCCKSFCVKLTYTVLILTTFTIGLFFSFDVYMKSRFFQMSKFDVQSAKVLTSGSQFAEIHTPLMGLSIGTGYYNPYTMCFSEYQNVQEEFYYFKGNKNTLIYTESFNRPVECVSVDYLEHNESNAVVYGTSLACSIVGIVLGFLFLICIWLCCSDWCRCCCCKPKVGIVNKGQIYV